MFLYFYVRLTLNKAIQYLKCFVFAEFYQPYGSSERSHGWPDSTGTTRSSAAAEIARVGGARYSLWRLRSFKVTDFGSNWRPVCDFRLVNNTNWHPISHRLPDIVKYWSTYRFWQGVPFTNESVLRNLWEYRHKSYVPKQILVPHFLYKLHGSIFTSFT